MNKNKFRKIIVYDNILLTTEQKQRLFDCADKVLFYPKTNNNDLIKKQIKDADAIINCWTIITKEVLEESKIQYMCNWGHWWKHRILLSEEELKKMGIHLDYIPDYGIDAVAELVWMSILSLSRNFNKWQTDAKKGKFTFENIKIGRKTIDISSIQERLIRGKILGIVGMGKIGHRVAQIGLKGFGTDIIYSSRTRKKELENDNFKFVSLEELFKQSDIISINVSPDAPLKLISKNLLELMKPGTIFVNTSMGNVVDQEALIEILKQEKIKAFLDVYEKFPPRKELMNLPNVIFTYRLGWFTKESLSRKGEILVSNIENYLKTKNDFSQFKTRS